MFGIGSNCTPVNRSAEIHSLEGEAGLPKTFSFVKRRYGALWHPSLSDGALCGYSAGRPCYSEKDADKIFAATLLAVRAIRKKTLTKSGAVAGFTVGFLMVSTGLRGMILFYFYQVGSMATKFKKSRKAELDGTVDESAVRGARQVLSVSILATLLSLYHAVVCGAERPIDFQSGAAASCLTCGILAHHATCLADTLASEMGILASRPPVLITRPWRTVPAGTNGGVTLNGLAWSAVGGMLVGLFYAATDLASGTQPVNACAMLGFGMVCGIIGSLLDSVAGALLQATYFDAEQKRVFHADSFLREKPPSLTVKHVCGADILNNEQVNLLSVAVTTYVGGWALGPWFFASFLDR